MSLDKDLWGCGMVSEGFIYQRLYKQTVITLRCIPHWPAGVDVFQEGGVSRL